MVKKTMIWYTQWFNFSHEDSEWNSLNDIDFKRFYLKSLISKEETANRVQTGFAFHFKWGSEVYLQKSTEKIISFVLIILYLET